MNTRSTPRGNDALLPALRRALDPSVSDIRITRLAGDASTRSYFRASYSTAPAPAGGRRRESVIIMVLNRPDPKIVSEEITDIAQTFTELPFVNIRRHLERAGIGVPTLLFADAAEGILLLEDLGDAVLAPVAEASPPEERDRLYRKAIDTLVLMQDKGSRGGEDCYAFRQSFTRDLFLWEFHHFLEYAIERSVGIMSGADRGEAEKYFHEISSRLSSEPRVFTHRDYHGWNILIKDDVIRLIDFQDALLGPRPYDLASLLLDRSTPGILGKALTGDLIGYYCRVAGLAEAPFRASFDLAGFQRCLKAAGRFVYISLEKKNAGYLPFVPGSLRCAGALLSRHGEFGGLLTLLGKYRPEMRT